MAALASSPKLAERPDAVCVTRELATVHSDARTPNWVAAAATSISLAAAPATRMPYCPVVLTESEPPVICRPAMRASR